MTHTNTAPTPSKPASTDPSASNQASCIAVRCAYTKLTDITQLIPNPRNPNKHGDKQIALLAKVIRHQGWRSPIVVSNRSGSGTTIIACERLNRKCRAMEISPAYTAVAIERWATATGKEPVLTNG